jgi:hypothetical protein
MRRLILSLTAASILLTSVAMSGCAVRARYYDGDHDDYHHWSHNEESFYVQWEGETHRHHRDFKDRSSQEQQEYWNWRHDHDHH